MRSPLRMYVNARVERVRRRLEGEARWPEQPARKQPVQEPLRSRTDGPAQGVLERRGRCPHENSHECDGSRGEHCAAAARRAL
jgi:hypothetical protein